MAVTAAQVKEILETSISDSIIESSFITTATAIRTGYLADKGLPTGILDKIELYLAAHFAALTEERGALTMSKVGDTTEIVASGPYANAGNEMVGGLRMTRYGQQAVALDLSGTLKNLNKTTMKAEFEII